MHGILLKKYSSRSKEYKRHVNDEGNYRRVENTDANRYTNSIEVLTQEAMMDTAKGYDIAFRRSFN